MIKKMYDVLNGKSPQEIYRDIVLERQQLLNCDDYIMSILKNIKITPTGAPSDIKIDLNI